MSEYGTEFWFDSVENTVIGWKGYFATEAEARKVFDAWLDSIRAEAWEEGWETGGDYCDGQDDSWITCNPYREEAE